jgi:hypothetical protein
MPLFQANDKPGCSLEGTGALVRRWQLTLRRISHFASIRGDFRMLVGALVTFLVVILILYLINLLPLDGRAKQICRVVVIILGVISLLKYISF